MADGINSIFRLFELCPQTKLAICSLYVVLHFIL